MALRILSCFPLSYKRPHRGNPPTRKSTLWLYSDDDNVSTCSSAPPVCQRESWQYLEAPTRSTVWQCDAEEDGRSFSLLIKGDNH